MSAAVISRYSDQLQSARREIRRFLIWWSSQLTSCIPSRWRKWLGSESALLSVRLDQTGITLSGKTTPAGILNLTDSRLEEGLDFRDLNGHSGLTVDVSPECTIRRRFKLPVAAEENLREVLEFELDRLTPFFAYQAYFDHQIVSRNEQHLTVEVTAIPRSTLEPLVQISEEYRLPIRKCQVPGEDYPGNLNLSRYLPTSIDGSSRVNRILRITLIVLLLSVCFWPVQGRYQEWAQWNSILDDVRAEAASLRELEKQVNQLEEENSRIQTLRDRYPSVATVIAELSMRLPDSVWLTELTYDADDATLQNSKTDSPSLLITGNAGSAKDIVSSLEPSRLFRELSFESSIRGAGNSGGETFSIRMDVVRGAGEDDLTVEGLPGGFTR